MAEADRLHYVGLCPDCEGVRTAVLDRIHVTDFTMTFDDGTTRSTGAGRVYVGPLDDTCPPKERTHAA